MRAGLPRRSAGALRPLDAAVIVVLGVMSVIAAPDGVAAARPAAAADNVSAARRVPAANPISAATRAAADPVAAASLNARPNPVLRGVILDESGAAIAGASVSAASAAWTVAGVSDTNGAFRLELPAPADLRVVVRAAGFAPVERFVSQADLGRDWRLVLPLAGQSEELTVTASRAEARLDDTAAAVATVSRGTLASSPSSTLDETLRQVPGFTLFRRTDSRVANPTTQGVSLRGLGASGASRALVLDDGVPLNDPFGGWVYWDRVPRAALERVEVMRGAASDLYGSGALGGVVNLVRRPAAGPELDVDAVYGSLASRKLAVSGGGRLRDWAARGATELDATNGWVPADPAIRGPVDTAAGRRYAVADVSAERNSGAAGSISVRASLFGESRDNGTRLTENNTRVAQLAGGGQWALARGLLQVRGYWSRQFLSQSFSAVSGDRNSERMTGTQHVPAGAAGGSVQWVAAFERQVLVAGLEVRQVSGATFERTPGSDNAWRVETEAGGRQRTLGLFLGDTIHAASRLTLAAGLRLDGWRNDRGRVVTRSAGEVVGRSDDAPRQEGAVSPRLSAVYRPVGHVALTASAYRAFRAPTLNELYRSFRVGNVVTNANAGLVAERLSGAEAGVRVTPFGGRLTAGARMFWMDLSRPVANVTTGTMAAVITRERENLGRIRSRGMEVDAQWRLAPGLRARAAYVLDEAVVASFEADPRLVGRAVPQQPRHSASAGLELTRSSVGTLTFQARWLGAQFDDDLNAFRLAPCGVVDAAARRRLAGPVSLFAAAENLAGRRCETAKTPATMLGAPRALRVGLRVTLGPRPSSS